MIDAPHPQPAAVRRLSAERVKERARQLGFALAGVTPVRGSAHADFYRTWLGRGLHGSMDYLAREDAVARRTQPDAAWPELRSAIVLAMTYGEEDVAAASSRDEADGAPGRGIVARYALSRDYHRVLKAKLLELLRWIESETGQRLEAARAYVDTGPVLERELAQRAGLGWFGRNTMLINPGLGSYFFLAALLVELELDADEPFVADRCGTCTRCLDACPTGALLGRDADGAPVMDATRCISYLTIEQRGPIPEELRPLIGDRIYGCDICQEVCPWNGDKVRAKAGPGAALTRVRARSVSLVEMLRMTHDEWDSYTRGSAMRRAGYDGLRRNVAVALGNALARGERPERALAALEAALGDDSMLVREHAAWALARANGPAVTGAGDPAAAPGPGTLPA
ncbi:MAG TPA: tRNA epoxyqueuosine(34) reductase QueG [Longimicrobiales bacterium]